jgi:hypothetical protein
MGVLTGVSTVHVFVSSCGTDVCGDKASLGYLFLIGLVSSLRIFFQADSVILDGASVRSFWKIFRTLENVDLIARI